MLSDLLGLLVKIFLAERVFGRACFSRHFLQQEGAFFQKAESSPESGLDLAVLCIQHALGGVFVARVACVTNHVSRSGFPQATAAFRAGEWSDFALGQIMGIRFGHWDETFVFVFFGNGIVSPLPISSFNLDAIWSAVRTQSIATAAIALRGM